MECCFFDELSALKLKKKCNRLTDLNCSCPDVAWKFRWMLDVNVNYETAPSNCSEQRKSVFSRVFYRIDRETLGSPIYVVGCVFLHFVSVNRIQQEILKIMSYLNKIHKLMGYLSISRRRRKEGPKTHCAL